MQAKLETAKRLCDFLLSVPGVRSCTLYGSLARGTGDTLSDIDIELDVSGQDNGLFLLRLPDLLRAHFPVLYHDFAPSLMPEKYIVSVALSEEDPFLIADLCCSAQPHRTTVGRAQAAALNDPTAHLIKLWTADLKHFARGTDCRDDIVRLAQKAGTDPALPSAAILRSTLLSLLSSAPERYAPLLLSCSRKLNELIPLP